MVDIPPTERYPTSPVVAGGRPLVSVPHVPGAENYKFATTATWGHSVEVGQNGQPRGPGFQFPWEPAPTRDHARNLSVASLWVQKYPVTNADYLSFLQRSNYTPIASV